MFGNSQNQNGQRGGPGQDLQGGFTTWAAFVLMLIFAPMLGEASLPYVIGIARRSYPPEFVGLFEVAWRITAFPFVFYAARAGIAYALTAAGLFLAYRLI